MRSDSLTQNSEWPRTDWSSVQRAAQGAERDVEALNQLILRYRTPLRDYLAAAFPSLNARTEELLQDFTQDRILREGWLTKADRSRGRFRDLLKSSLKNFVRDQLRRSANSPLSLDQMELDVPAETQGEQAFEVGWARTLLHQTLARMELDCRTPGKDQPRRSQIWEVFRLRVLQPILEDAEPIGYAELIQRTGIASPFDAHNMLATAKRIFARHLETVITEYEGGGEAVKSEIAELRQFLAALAERKAR